MNICVNNNENYPLYTDLYLMMILTNNHHNHKFLCNNISRRITITIKIVIKEILTNKNINSNMNIKQIR